MQAPLPLVYGPGKLQGQGLKSRLSCPNPLAVLFLRHRLQLTFVFTFVFTIVFTFALLVSRLLRSLLLFHVVVAALLVSSLLRSLRLFHVIEAV